MDKDNEIEEFAKKFCGYKDRKCKLCCSYLYGQCVETCPYLKFAKELVNDGYGNIKQAVKEFADKLEYNLENFYGYECIDLRTEEFSGGEVLKAIKNTFKEFYGE